MAILIVLAAGLALAMAGLVTEAAVALGRPQDGLLARSRVAVAGVGVGTATFALALLLAMS